MSYSLDPLTAPAYSVKEGNGWLAVFNPDARRQMDVQFRSGYTHNGCVLSALRGNLFPLELITTLSFLINQGCLLRKIFFRWITTRSWNRQCNHPIQY